MDYASIPGEFKYILAALSLFIYMATAIMIWVYSMAYRRTLTNPPTQRRRYASLVIATSVSTFTTGGLVYFFGARQIATFLIGYEEIRDYAGTLMIATVILGILSLTSSPLVALFIYRHPTTFAYKVKNGYVLTEDVRNARRNLRVYDRNLRPMNDPFYTRCSATSYH